jgi:peptidoglycan/LPS O-acetylase OafA/YrhL
MLNTHLVFGFVVIVAALVAIFDARARRVVVYLLTLQIVVGAVLWWTTKVSPPPLHWIPPLLIGGVYSAANALERRGRAKSTILALTIFGALLFSYIFYIGLQAAGKQ